MFARFDENPAMTLQDMKETKRYGRTDGRTDNVKTVYPPQTKFGGGGGIIMLQATGPLKSRLDSIRPVPIQHVMCDCLFQRRDDAPDSWRLAQDITL